MKARVIAYYLPQYHPIPENDKYWGKGFTEWTNVAKSRPLFRGHHQPNIPADLGFYDLRMPEVREQQAQLAREAGIEGFCYWHYWFGGGKELLERPFNEVVDSGKPDFPFCLGWANHSWSTKTWLTGGEVRNEMIAEMKYPGKEDYILHFNTYLKAFKDKRYIKVDGKLLFVVFAPRDMPDTKEWMECWQQLAKENGLPGFYFVGVTLNFSLDSSKKNITLNRKGMDADAKKKYKQILDMGYDGVNSRGFIRANVLSVGAFRYYFRRFLQKIGMKVTAKVKYKDIIENFYTEADGDDNIYPTIIPNFDRTPRAGWNNNALWYKSTPALFKKHVKAALRLIKNRSEDKRLLFLQSWNEWGEGNYMEPDRQFGHGYIDALREALDEE